ncbi:hypothetical protein [Nitrobacter sp.]|uniref:hypothetical protein n=1 Tax=Nitrobacter sp. TaxID=29420 RepID=UPI0029CABBC5|nr:hypothetical protein [Nitrobacter sp.]
MSHNIALSATSSSSSRRRRKRIRSWQESYDGRPITPDAVLAAIRQHDKYLRTVPRRDYEMRAFEDGSVRFRNTEIPGREWQLSLDDIIRASGHFHLSPNRPLWKHILLEWL